ncbi:MAG TPA: hypothetical protein VM487_26370 [Phycisphaerae bacterium]|nr:hypothetical protein [Phycisphaerae bacterium]
MAEIERMIAETVADRAWFAMEARRRRNHGMFIDAAACAIRERALRDALAALKRETAGG